MLLRALLAFAALPGMVAFVVPALIASRAAAPAGLQWLGLVPGCLGTAGLLVCVVDFYRSGRGTLATWAPPARLVTVHLYRLTRNPMYVCVLSIHCGWALLYGSPALLLYALAVGAVFHLHVVLVEEPWCARRFGAEWEAYRQAVPRWLRITRHPLRPA